MTITVKPFYGMWEAFELPGVQPLFSSRERAIEAARRLLHNRSGVIEIHDARDVIDEIIDLRRQEAAVCAI